MKFMFVLLGILWLSYELQLGCCLNCNGDQYTVVDSNDVDKECLNCGECHPAYGKFPRCGTRVTEPVVSHCIPCPTGTFSDKDDTAPCKQCHHCVRHEKITSPCTNVSDTVCNGTCDHGYFFTKKAPHNCQECSYCCNDGKDTIQQECVNQGLNASNQHCSVRLDKYCGPTTVTTDALQPTDTQASGGGGSSSTLVIVLGVLGALVFVVVVLLIAYFYVQRRKKQGRTIEVDANSAQQHAVDVGLPGTSLNFSVDDSPSTNNTSDRPKTPQRIAFNLENPTCSDSKPGTPQLSERPADSDDKSDNQLPIATSNNGSNKFMRQTSTDSKKSTQSGENGDQVSSRKRSRSSSFLGNVEAVARKMSLKREDSLLPQDDMEEDQVPEIEVHPQSQKVPEGDRVEFSCKVKGKKKVLYQWLKDDTDIQGKCSQNLLLNPVKFRDSGSYTCSVRYENCEVHEAVMTSPAELAVFRYKLLKDIDQTAEEKICDLLGNEVFGVGGCHLVAEKYCMEKHKIRYLAQSQHPGKDLFDFLGASHPDLTVYEFCEFLKGKHIQRLDVVKELQDNLVVKNESA